MNQAFTFSAPGSLMLMGEHAVLRGEPAVVCAVNRRMRATLRARGDRLVRIVSALGEHTTSLDRFARDAKLRFVTAAIAEHVAHVPSGFDLDLVSEFSATIGFGSSAAATVLAQALLRTWRGLPVEAMALIGAARDTVRTVQGRASGADVAASVLGGAVLFRVRPEGFEAGRMDMAHPLTAVYSGAKTPTPEVIRIVDARRDAEPARYDALFQDMGRAALEAAAAIVGRDWPRLGRTLDAGQALMVALGVSNAALDRIVAALRSDPGILGAKISGSGLGDCAVGLGRARDAWTPGEMMPVEVDPMGLRGEAI